MYHGNGGGDLADDGGDYFFEAPSPFPIRVKWEGMVKKFKSLIFPFIAVLALLISSTVALRLRNYEPRQGKTAQETPSRSDVVMPEESVVVKRVIDGDIFVTEKDERVRLLGINAPELKDPDGEPAKRFLEEKILGETVTLKFDKKDRVDVYGRKLAYVYKKGYFVNKELLRQGLALTYIIHPIEKEAELKDAEAVAKAEGRGLWWESYRRRLDDQNR